eukprot:TRINITY_DN3840_c0_g4_i3.p1 TRINITY_DN3840_c0_g4~~TRINITY_DN3840_c0_g4_i3.p1  ORF type:complete len:174 (+),score=9.02 TRINITY_DN3840_c0_g4_i3:158-679(+)
MLSASLYGKEVSNDDTLVSSYDNEDDRSPIERRTSHSIHLARNHLVCNIVLQLLIFAAMLFFALAENWCTLKKNSIVGLLFLHYKGENYLLYHYRSEDLCTDQFPIGIEECKRVIWFALAGFAVPFFLPVGHSAHRHRPRPQPLQHSPPHKHNLRKSHTPPQEKCIVSPNARK